MRNVILTLLFVLGVLGAFLGHHFFKGNAGHDVAKVGTKGDYCTMACCLPYHGELNDSQQETLMGLEKNYCRCRDRLSREIDKKRLALADMLLQDDPDMMGIERLLKETATLQSELEKETIKHILGVKSQLEPPDQERFITPIVAEIRKRCFHQKPLQESESSK